MDEAGVLMQGENQIGVCMSSLNVSANDVCLLTTVGPERESVVPRVAAPHGGACAYCNIAIQ